MDDHVEISSHLRDAVKREYEVFIMSKMLAEKRQRLAKWKKRSDYDETLQVVSNDPKYEIGMFRHPAEEAIKEDEETFDELEDDENSQLKAHM